jgi:hypothetical protein
MLMNQITRKNITAICKPMIDNFFPIGSRRQYFSPNHKIAMIGNKPNRNSQVVLARIASVIAKAVMRHSFQDGDWSQCQK